MLMNRNYLAIIRIWKILHVKSIDLRVEKDKWCIKEKDTSINLMKMSNCRDVKFYASTN
jgi:hypothetical protein